MGLIGDAVDPLKLDQVGKQLHRYLGEKALCSYPPPNGPFRRGATGMSLAENEAGRRRLWQVLVGAMAAAAELSGRGHD